MDDYTTSIWTEALVGTPDEEDKLEEFDFENRPARSCYEIGKLGVGVVGGLGATSVIVGILKALSPAYMPVGRFKFLKNVAMTIGIWGLSGMMGEEARRWIHRDLSTMDGLVDICDEVMKSRRTDG